MLLRAHRPTGNRHGCARWAFGTRVRQLRRDRVAARCGFLGVALATLLVSSGCQTTQRALDAGGERARAIIGGVDPTGLAQETEERRKFWDAARSRLEAMDIDALNTAIVDASITLAQLSERVEAVSPDTISEMLRSIGESLAAVHAQLNELKLQEVVTTTQDLARTADQKLAAIDPEQVNALLRDTDATVVELCDTVSWLSGNVDRTLSETQTLLRSVNESLRGMPFDETRAALVELSPTLGSLRQTTQEFPTLAQAAARALTAATLVLHMAAGVLVLLGLLVVIWMVRALRRPARSGQPER